MSFTTEYSGIILNQNQPVPTPASRVSGSVWQDFFLPPDYQRAPTASNAQIPSLTGLQVYANLPAGGTVTWTFQHYDITQGWVGLATGTSLGAPFAGDQWLNLFFASPIDVGLPWLTDRFRFQVAMGTNSVYYSIPPANPNAGQKTRAYTDGSNTGLAVGASPVLDAFREVSLRFRVLANVVDSGTDFLGNPYRSLAVRQSVNNVATVGSQDASWMSGPQPSRFAVVSNYFDQRQNGLPSVINRILVDPVTPNVFFHVYYSMDSVDPTGFGPEDWDNLLWTSVPATFQAKRRETHLLPAPITANFVKIEFSHLQARPYSTSDFQRPILYRKHPKWVLDYFLTRAQADKSTDDHFIADAVAVTFNALDLAYNYYLDDLSQEPDHPVQLATSAGAIKDFLSALNDSSDLVDPATLRQIRTTFDVWRSNPAMMGKLDFLPSSLARSTAESTQSGPGTYPSEGPTPSLVNRDLSVSYADRDPVVFEQSFPVMSFFLTCRHVYRKLSAPLTHDRAYFVGIREIQFDRDLYSTVFDDAVYTDTMNDGINAERNDMLKPNYTTTLVRA